MRRFITTLSAVAVLQMGLGCHHVGGKCDCGPTPGDARSYAPTATYSGPVGTTAPTTALPAPGYEPIAPPKSMPK